MYISAIRMLCLSDKPTKISSQHFKALMQRHKQVNSHSDQSVEKIDIINRSQLFLGTMRKTLKY